VIERVPIVRIGSILLASIQIDLSDESALALQDDLSTRVVEVGARGVIIDISGLEIVDSFVGRMLSTIASTTRVLDAETVVVGMRPAVAITLAELGLSLGGVRTALNADKAFEMLRESASEAGDEAGDLDAFDNDGGDEVRGGA
jgi:rsbT antagonist protein RsbS